MSTQIYLRYKCGIYYNKEASNLIKIDESLIDYSFNVSDNEVNVKIKLLTDGKTIEAESVVDSFNPNILQILRSSSYDTLTNEEKTELSNISRPIRKAVRQFVGLLKQELHRFDISDELIGNPYEEWSTGDNKWYRIPRGLYAFGWTTSLGNLDATTVSGIQELLNDNEEALVATNYLHQARNFLMNRRYQWIYATMAAELAIKEILIKIEPKLKVILEMLPSPPIKKLYGEVLNDVAGEKSSNLSKLEKGAAKRNQLIHNPKSQTPTREETTAYIEFIEDRVTWLLKIWRKKVREKAENT